MKFLRQIKFEIRNILKSKFLLIIGIIIVAFSILLPIIGVITQAIPNNNGGRPIPLGGVYYTKAMAYSYDKFPGGDGNQETITVNGVTISSDNPFFWSVKPLVDEKAALAIDTARYSTPEATDLALALIDVQIDYYLHFVQYIVNPQDYRLDLAWRGSESLNDKFVYEHIDVPAETMIEVYYRGKMGDTEMLKAFKKKYYDITPADRQAAYIKVDESINTIYNVIENADFPKYIELRIAQETAQKASLQANIALLQQNIIDNPSQEENLNQQIEETNKQIKMIDENNIPTLNLRLEKKIIPGEATWQNAAIGDMENSRMQLMYLTQVPQEEFNKRPDLIEQYKTYKKYLSMTQAQINTQNNNLFVAKESLNAEKPDMKYVANGSRSKTVSFLDFSVIIALFAVLVGGWIMASEFQQGTIRLLMIRPKKRVKILLSKFTAAFAICLAMYLASCVLNIVTNGICFGFADYLFPNYTIAGQVSFFAYFVPMFLICIITILFAFSVAFMLSVVVKNIAVSIAIPIVCFIGCYLSTSGIAYRTIIDWIGYTPIPYVQLSSFFVPNSMIKMMMDNGVSLSMPLGIGYLVVLSAVCITVSIMVFNKRDIAN